MSGSTTELALKTAVDSDDNADYLTINLASSLQTLDALFSNTTGHTHSGAHQGGPVTLPDGSITSAKIADGTIGTADLANSAVTNAKLAADTARANLLTNGGFEIWQRGAGAFTADGAYTADRWQLALNVVTASVTRDNVASDSGSQYNLQIVASGASGTASLWQKLENSLQLRGRTVTLSARVKASAVSKVRVSLYDGTQFFGTANTTTSYETLTLTTVLSGSATDIRAYIVVDFGCTANIDNAMLVVGSVVADYAPLHPADDLGRCLRYYEVITGAAQFATGYLPSTTSGRYSLRYSPKAVTPTITFPAAANFSINDSITPSSLSADNVALSSCRIIAIASGLTAGQGSILSLGGGSPVLSIEANP
jgi:hypothetical protein